MISLFPQATPETVEVHDAVSSEARTPTGARPWVMTNMIASADGATAVDGLSGGLGGPADKTMFMAIRSVSDAIVVGARTASEESYRPPSGGDERARAARARRGQAERPLIVVVTTSLSLNPDLPLFSDETYRPLIATVTDAPAERRGPLSEVADLIDCGEGRVDLGRLIDELGRRAHRTVLAEGGPALNGQLIAEDLIDEWNLTVSPILASGQSSRPAHGPEPLHPRSPMRLDRVWQDDELLFCRWVRA